MLRSLVACAVLTLLFVVANCAFANPVVVQSQGVVRVPASAKAAERQAIRQMPLLMRPNRPGHFYGNTVRRLYYGR